MTWLDDKSNVPSFEAISGGKSVPLVRLEFLRLGGLTIMERRVYAASWEARWKLQVKLSCRPSFTAPCAASPPSRFSSPFFFPPCGIKR